MKFCFGKTGFFWKWIPGQARNDGWVVRNDGWVVRNGDQISRIDGLVGKYDVLMTWIVVLLV